MTLRTQIMFCRRYHSFLQSFPLFPPPARATGNFSFAFGQGGTCVYAVGLYGPVDAISVYLGDMNPLCVTRWLWGAAFRPFILTILFTCVSPLFSNQRMPSEHQALRSVTTVRVSILCGCINPLMCVLSVSQTSQWCMHDEFEGTICIPSSIP